jgi:voltage-gated potassium channel Kch
VTATASAQTVPASASGEEAPLRPDSSMYELFMGVLTIMSLGVMGYAFIVRVQQVDAILASVDSLLCIAFLLDFVRSVRRAPDVKAYLFGERPGRTLPTGVLDLLSSIPSIGIFRFFRIFRLARVARIVRAKGAKGLAREFIARRAESAVYLIALASLLVLLFGSTAIAFVEPPNPDANIKTGGDAFWWAFVTITTVGYGDRFPVTEAGRLVGMLTMAVGIGIFGVLTSYLSSLFMAPAAVPEGTPPEPTMADLAAELAAVRRELAELRTESGGA